jgi:hypothetical protein
LRRALEPEADDDDLSPAALLAAATVSSAFAEARAVKTELLYGVQDVLTADTPTEEATPVDEIFNPFAGDPERADIFLRRLGPKDRVEHVVLRQRNARRPRWEHYVRHARTRAFDAAREAAQAEARRQRLPDPIVSGPADQGNLADRADGLAGCLCGPTPFVLVNPISGPDCFLAVHGDGLWASAAIAAIGLEDTATAVASGPAVTVTSRGRGLISLGRGPWIPITETSQTPELITSNLILPGGVVPVPSFQFVAPPEMDALSWLSGNAMILNALVLGGIGAAFLPSCYPWDACAVPAAAAAGRTVARVDTQECLGPLESEQLLFATILRAERLPGLVIARHEVAARRLVRKVREYPA